MCIRSCLIMNCALELMDLTGKHNLFSKICIKILVYSSLCCLKFSASYLRLMSEHCWTSALLHWSMQLYLPVHVRIYVIVIVFTNSYTMFEMLLFVNKVRVVCVNCLRFYTSFGQQFQIKMLHSMSCQFFKNILLWCIFLESKHKNGIAFQVSLIFVQLCVSFITL